MRALLELSIEEVGEELRVFKPAAAQSLETLPHDHGSAAQRQRWIRALAWPLALVIATLIPYLAALIGVPSGDYFRGSLRPSTDEAVYLTAVRLGAAGDWLWHDPFVVHSPAPVLMYPTYVLAGHAGALLGMAPRTVFIAYHVAAILLLAFSIWCLARIFLDNRRRAWFVAFALCTANLLWLDAVLAVVGRAPVRLSPLEHETVSGFSMALISGHYAVGFAGHVAALTGVVGFLYDRPALRLCYFTCGVTGMVVLGLAGPVYLPLTLGTLVLFSAWHVWHDAQLSGHVLQRIRHVAIVCGAIAAPGLAFALYYYALLDHGVWAGLWQLGRESTIGSLFDWGFLLPAAAWGWYAAPSETRPLKVLLGLWCAIAAGGWVLNLYQSTRLTDGITIPLGGLICLGTLRLATTARRRVFFIAGFSLVCQYLFLLSGLLQGNSASLYDTAGEEQAIQWLAHNAQPADVVLAPYLFGNVIPEGSAVHVVAGQNSQTYDLSIRYGQLTTFYGAASTVAQRLDVLRRTGATLVAYDGNDLAEGPYDPRGLPALRLVFAVGNVALLRVAPGY